MISRKMRKGLLGGVALMLAGLMAGEAGAAGGIVINSSICDNVFVPSVVEWATTNETLKFGNLFYMTDEGNVTSVIGDKKIDEMDRLLIASHGTCDKTGSVKNEEFADNLKKAGVSDDLDLIVSASCFAAQSTKGNDSQLKSLQKAFPDVGLLAGATGPTALSTIGHRSLKNAQLANNPALYAVPAAVAGPEYLALAQEVKDEWASLDPYSAKTYCELFVAEMEVDDGETSGALGYFVKFAEAFRNTFVKGDNLIGRHYSYYLPSGPMLTCGKKVTENPARSAFEDCP